MRAEVDIYCIFCNAVEYLEKKRKEKEKQNERRKGKKTVRYTEAITSGRK